MVIIGLGMTPDISFHLMKMESDPLYRLECDIRLQARFPLAWIQIQDRRELSGLFYLADFCIREREKRRDFFLADMTTRPFFTFPTFKPVFSALPEPQFNYQQIVSEMFKKPEPVCFSLERPALLLDRLKSKPRWQDFLPTTTNNKEQLFHFKAPKPEIDIAKIAQEMCKVIKPEFDLSKLYKLEREEELLWKKVLKISW